METLTWPPPITIKKHARARHVKLKASPHHGLELVVPKRFNVKDVPLILEENKAWIQKHLLQFQAQQKENIQIKSLPHEIYFPLTNETWKIEYLATPTRLRILNRPHQQLVVMGNIENLNLCQQILKNWVKKYAHRTLFEKLNEVCQRTQLPYSKLIIHNQQSRWGSCSSEKTISLNYKLIFLPCELVTHVLIHELCHTVHLNHSDKFWKLVEYFDPDFQINKRKLKHADEFIPGWVRA